MINKNSKNITVRGYSGKFDIVEEVNYMNNKVFLAKQVDEFWSQDCPDLMALSEDGLMVLEKCNSKEDYIKHHDRLESRYGWFSNDMR